MPLTPKSFFKTGGLINNVKPNFSPREGQEELSNLILKAIQDQKHIVSEAPTGFGKSFAVLVPAIIEAIENNRKTVISTETITLQDQYLMVDLPLLARALEPLGIKLNFAAAKGKNNYLCRAKVLEESGQRTPLTKWASLQELPQTGDIATADFDFDISDWKALSGDDDCERKGCELYGDGAELGGTTQCFIFEARKRILEAEIVVTNHTMLLLDIHLGKGSLLGDYEVVIIDEAHSFPEKAQDCWGISLHQTTISKTLRTTDKILNRVGADIFDRDDFDGAKEHEKDIFHALSKVKETTVFGKIPNEVKTEISEALGNAYHFIRRLTKKLSNCADSKDTPRNNGIEVACENLRKLSGTLASITGGKIDEEYAENWLSFVETSWDNHARRMNRSLHLKPIIVAPLLKTNLLDQVRTAVFLSATLRIGGSYSFIRSELGLAKDNSYEFTGQSPFDYYKQVEMYMPTHLPETKDPDYIQKLCDEVVSLINRSNGKTLVLFTNISHMRAVHEQVSQLVSYDCYIQGQASRGVLLGRFQDEVHSCLFATRSFFTGVDIPGEALSSVILVKAPFRVPSDPMFKARCDLIDAEGGNSFSGFSLPLMLFDVKQAFGRLIRTTTDTGMFAFLDSRALRSSYKNNIVYTLPETKIVRKI